MMIRHLSLVDWMVRSTRNQSTGIVVKYIFLIVKRHTVSQYEVEVWKMSGGFVLISSAVGGTIYYSYNRML